MKPSRYEFLLGRARALATMYLNGLTRRQTTVRLSRDELWERLYFPLPEEPTDDGTVLEHLVQAVDPGLMASAGPRYFGFVTGGAQPIGIAADWMATAWDQNVGLYAQSPAMAVMEDVVAQWVRELLGLPQNASIGFTTGCHMANMVALAAPPNALFKQIGWNFEQYGWQAAARICVYVPEDVHVSIIGALRILGMGDERVMRIPCDYQGRMDVDALIARMKENIGPALIVAQAGNVNTGCVDDLERIAMHALNTKSWLHVDGAFGLWAMTSSTRSRAVRGVPLASSWATDAHKWLNVPYDCGIVAIGDSAAHRAAMSLNAAYLERSAREERNGMDWVPESSRRARVVSLYATIHALGREGVAKIVDRCCDLALEMADYFREAPGAEVLNHIVLNQILVAFEPPDGRDADEWNREIVRRVQQDGTCWVGGTVWKGRYALRISICNWQTTERDIDLSARAILRSAGLPMPAA